jgi:SAM-dependent methyltransferase
MKLNAINPIKLIYSLIRNEIMARSGLQPRGSYAFSKLGIKYEYSDKSGLRVPNLSGNYHSVLKQFWEVHGLGRECLLVSESKRVKILMRKIYPGVSFTTADLYPELLGKEACDKPDIVWDVCLPPNKHPFPKMFDSIICHALLEHVIAPTTAIKNMFNLLVKGGYLYALTHTPSFPLHRYPRDYFRFQHDYFEDLPSHLLQLYCIKVELMELYSKEGVVILAYKKISE